MSWAVKATCQYCDNEDEIAFFDNKPDADRYAKEQRTKRDGFKIEVESV